MTDHINNFVKDQLFQSTQQQCTTIIEKLKKIL